MKLTHIAAVIIFFMTKYVGKSEILISRLITRWRESVWQHSANLLEPLNAREQDKLVKQVEQEALKLGDFICRGKVRLPRQG